MFLAVCWRKPGKLL